jgi:hypothetical protein
MTPAVVYRYRGLYLAKARVDENVASDKDGWTLTSDIHEAHPFIVSDYPPRLAAAALAFKNMKSFFESLSNVNQIDEIPVHIAIVTRSEQ